MSRPEDYYPFPCPTGQTIATSKMDRGYVQKWEAYPKFESLQRSIWTASVELTSQARTSLTSMVSSSSPRLPSHRPDNRRCHCTLWLGDAMWLYASSTSTGSNIEMLSILPWHTSQWYIHLELWTVAGNQCPLDHAATCMWIPVIGRRARPTPEFSCKVSSHP